MTFNADPSIEQKLSLIAFSTENSVGERYDLNFDLTDKGIYLIKPDGSNIDLSSLLPDHFDIETGFVGASFDLVQNAQEKLPIGTKSYKPGVLLDLKEASYELKANNFEFTLGDKKFSYPEAAVQVIRTDDGEVLWQNEFKEPVMKGAPQQRKYSGDIRIDLVPGYEKVNLSEAVKISKPQIALVQ